MRSSEEIYSLVLSVAQNDERIRAVILNGSRANPKLKEDRFSDFDIVYIVTHLESFTSDHKWIEVFGETLIVQMPDQMVIPESVDTSVVKTSFGYLMLFKDGNRIDLTLFLLDKVKDQFHPGSLSIVLLDKDKQFSSLPPASDKDFIIKQPKKKEFSDCCNEFWWVSTYVAKGLWRKEITYAKSMMENPVRNMFMQMLEWYVGIKTDFSVSSGKNGKYLEKYIEPALWKRVLATYPDAEIENTWKALFLMTRIFSEIAQSIALKLVFNYNTIEAENVKNYLEEIKLLQK
jgi:aminoglycoside 6-adenylyltransferase